MRNVAYIPLDEPEEDEEVEESPPPDFQEGDFCVTTEKIVRNYGVIGEGTIVEVKKRNKGKDGPVFDIETQPCKSCLTIILMRDVPMDKLEDYELSNPYQGF